MPVLTKKNATADTHDAVLVKHARTLRRWRNSIDTMLGEIGLKEEVLTIPRMARRGVPREAAAPWSAKDIVKSPTKNTILSRKPESERRGPGRPRKSA